MMRRFFLCALLPFSLSLAAECWHFDIGTSYVIPYGYSTSGDMSSISLVGDSYPIYNKNLTYSSELSANFALSRDLFRYFRLGLNYEYVELGISSVSGITGAGADYAGTTGSYAGSLNINTILATGRYTMPPCVCICSTPISFFVEAGIGTANQSLYHQFITFNNGGTFAQIAPHAVWVFAYMAEVGFQFPLSGTWSLDAGARYTNYGAYSSGTKPVDFPNNRLNAPVSAHLWAIAPFLELGICF